MASRPVRAAPRARLGPGLDLPDLASALASPRMDTRLWASEARVLDPWLDPKHGYMADVLLLPSGEQDTVRVGCPLAATDGFFIYAPLWKNDLVLVVYPEGVTSQGGYIVGKPAWLEAAPPPQDVLDHPQDLILFAREGANARITVAGSGNIVLTVAGGQVRLGSDAADRKVARKDDPTANGTLALTTVPAGPSVTCTLIYTPPGGIPQTVGSWVMVGTGVAGSASLSGKVDDGADEVRSV